MKKSQKLSTEAKLNINNLAVGYALSLQAQNTGRRDCASSGLIIHDARRIAKFLRKG